MVREPDDPEPTVGACEGRPVCAGDLDERVRQGLRCACIDNGARNLLLLPADQLTVDGVGHPVHQRQKGLVSLLKVIFSPRRRR